MEGPMNNKERSMPSLSMTRVLIYIESVLLKCGPRQLFPAQSSNLSYDERKVHKVRQALNVE